MALKVVLYRHNKKINSTATPPETVVHQEYDGVMIDGADMLHPKIAVRFATPESCPSFYNYAYIDSFSKRYYYIDNWVYDCGRWVAFMSVDVLASYKTDIGASEQYILRSSRLSDPSVCDMLYPVTSSVSITRTDVSLVSDSYYKEDGSTVGCYVVGVLNRDMETAGTVSYYAFNGSQIRSLAAYLMGDFSWLNINPEDMSEELAKTLINPLQYISSCVWFPFSPEILKNVSNLSYGWWTLNGINCSAIKTTRTDLYIGGYTIPTHSQGDNISYLNAAPYTTCTLVAEPWGSIEIPTKAYNGEHRLYCSIDFITGKAILEVKASNAGIYTTLARREAQMGVSVKMSQISVDTMKTVASAVNGVAGTLGAVFSGNVAGSISNAMSGIHSTIDAAKPNLSATGVDGSYLAYCFKPYIITRQCDTVSRDNERYGSPYSKKDAISNHDGYVLCGNPSVTLTEAFPSEIESVNEHLSSGFYYE